MTYNGTQRVIAYRRVLERLRPIIKQAGRVRQEFTWALIDKEEP
jgi:hypothetical protein